MKCPKLKIILSVFLGMLVGLRILNAGLYPPKLIMSYVVPEDFSSKEVIALKSKLSHLNLLAYAFISISPTGAASVETEELPEFKQFASLQSPEVHLKKLISVGGATDEAAFFYAIEHREAFIKSVQALLQKYQLDGIDLDFEINRSYQAQEADLYVALLMHLRRSWSS